MIGVKMRRFTMNDLRESRQRWQDMGTVKVYGFPYIDFFQQRRGKVWHSVRQILTTEDGRQCERLVQANTGGYRILRVIVRAHVGTQFAFRYKVVCE